jgi:hypothetical protein
MNYLRYLNGAVTYPYSLAQLRREHPNTSFPASPQKELLAEFGMFPVSPSARPAPSDSARKDVVEITPILVSGVWTQAWGEVDVSADEVAVRLAATVDNEHMALVKGDAFVEAFVKMTPAQVADYMEANVTSLGSARTVITKLALIVMLLARRELR